MGEIAAQHGVLASDVRMRHDALWKRLGVPQGLASVQAEAILQRTWADKKRVGNTVRYILAEDIGRVNILQRQRRNGAVCYSLRTRTADLWRVTNDKKCIW